MIYIKSENDIKLIRQACTIWRKVKEELIRNTKIGISTNELDKIAKEVMIKNNATPTFLNYGGFPKNICISVNDELIHGIPNERIIKDKDMVTFDIGVTYQNHVCDSAFTIIIGENKEAEKINKATLECLYSTIDIIKPGVRVGDLGNMTQTIAKKNGYEVIKDFSGHGCGNFLHEDPPIFNFGMKGQGIKLVKNMIICIEPMLLTDSDEYFIDKKNNWTIYSKNHKLTCHNENMVLVTENGYEILNE